VSIAFYYKDPDGNTIELFVDNFGNWDRSMEHMQSSPDFNRTVALMTIGTFVDAEKLVAARQAGMSFAELHRRAYAGEFPASRPMNPHDLI
jgi:catechol-2,3-dioxygenase